MSGTDPHTLYIALSYAGVGLVVLGLILVSALDWRRQNARLARLEAAAPSKDAS